MASRAARSACFRLRRWPWNALARSRYVASSAMSCATSPTRSALRSATLPMRSPVSDGRISSRACCSADRYSEAWSASNCRESPVRSARSGSSSNILPRSTLRPESTGRAAAPALNDVSTGAASVASRRRSASLTAPPTECRPPPSTPPKAMLASESDSPYSVWSCWAASSGSGSRIAAPTEPSSAPTPPRTPARPSGEAAPANSRA